MRPARHERLNHTGRAATARLLHMNGRLDYEKRSQYH